MVKKIPLTSAVPLPERISGAPTGINKPDEAIVISTTEQTPSSAAGWPPVDLSFLVPATAPAPPFPIKLLPENLRATILGFSQARHLSIDYVACALLTAFSGAIGNRLRIQTFDGNAEPMAVFTTIVGPPSTGKSQAISIAEAPLWDIDQQLRQAHTAISGHLGHSAIGKFDKRIQQTIERRLELEGLTTATENAGSTPPSEPPGIILSETTGAGLLDELRNGCEGRMLLSHEITGALSFGAAHQGLRSRALLLEGFDGKPRAVRTKVEGKIIIPSLLISILGATQPTRLKDLLGDAHDGLAARMWWIFPDIAPVTRLPSSPGPTDALKQTLTRLVAISPAGPPGPSYSTLMPLSAQTRAPLEDAAGRWARHAVLTDGLYRDFVGRASQHALRLAGLLCICEHVAAGRDGLPSEIGVSAVIAAIAFLDQYLLPMAERTLGAARNPLENAAARLARFLVRLGKSVINVRTDIHRAAGAPVRDTEAVAEAVEELRQRGVLRPVSRSEMKLGRPGQNFEVNPALLVFDGKPLK